jgi:hypothetical protein
LASLVDLGLFERIDRTGTYAPIYRLLVACPGNCFDLDQHNTKQELAALKTLGGTNTPPLSDKNTAPYIDQREEEDFSARIQFEEGSEELGFILKALEEITSLTPDQLTLKGLIELHPKALAKVALDLTKKLDSPKRKKAYLAKITKDTPQNLLEGAETYLAGVEGSQRLLKDTWQPEQDLSNYTPETTSQRVKQYAQEVAGLNPKGTLPWLMAQSSKGDLNLNKILLAQRLEEILEEARSWLPKHLQKETAPLTIHENKEGLIYLYGHLDGFSGLPHLQTAEELRIYEERRSGLEKLLEAWNKANPNEKGSAKFWSEPEVIEFHQKHPEPLTLEQKQERFFAYFNKALNSTAKEFLAAQKENLEEETFSFWLSKNFNAETDLKDLLSYLPERPEGHEANLKKALPAYLNARKTYSQIELIASAERYEVELIRKGSPYPLTPSKWLEGLLKDTSKIERIF